LRRYASPDLLGAVVAASLWSPLALLLLGGSDDPRGQALAFAGLVVSPLVGGLLTDRALTSGGLGAGVAFQFAVVSVLPGALLVGLLFALLDGHNPFFALGFAIVGLVFLGIPLLILGFKLALVWVAIVRWLLRRDSRQRLVSP
jgi:hypothetical protein